MKICTECIPKRTADAIHAAQRETEENVPDLRAALGTPLGTPNQDLRESATMLTGKKWAAGRTLKCSFDWTGDQRVKERVKAVANQWMEFANIKFDWVGGGGDVRIAFVEGDGSWSYLGTDCLTIPRNQPTMNFGWLTPATDEVEYHRVVLHEFGHTLGMPHEHQNPAGGIPWDVDAVYRYYSGPPNYWDRETIEQNIFTQYAETQTVHTELDRASIMLYAIPNELTIGDWWVGWNTELSDQDKEFIRWQYPGKEDKSGKEPPELTGLRRVAFSRYSRRDLDEEVVLTYNDKDRIHAIPVEAIHEEHLIDENAVQHVRAPGNDPQ